MEVSEEGDDPVTALMPSDSPSHRVALRLAWRAQRLNLAAVVTGICVVVCVIGVMVALWVEGSVMVRGFNPRGEQNVVAASTAAALGVAGVLTLVVAELSGALRIRPAPQAVFGLFLGYMALDEFLELHERVEIAAGGTSWMWFYAPLVALAGLAWLHAVSDLRARPLVVALLVGGSVAWAASQMLEYRQWGGNSEVLVHPWMMVPEETLELVGSFLFGGAALLLLGTPEVRAATAADRPAWRPKKVPSPREMPLT